MRQVLHITAHMGGGVGKILSSVATHSKKNSYRYNHKILMLEPPEKMQFVDDCKQAGVEILISSDKQYIEQQIRKADIIQLEWWHHPKMAQLLSMFPQIPLRLIIWSHISGCNYPVTPFEFIKLPHRFLFTSRYSLENPFWNREQREYAAANAVVINSSGGGFMDPCAISKAVHNGNAYHIGYIGTLSYSKLHPNFIEYCVAVDIPEARFILVGDTQNQRAISVQAVQKGIQDKMEFAGYSTNVSAEFARFDVFGYLLNPDHFGTTENVLLEAMAFGLPVIALNQTAEKHLIEHGQTGLLANSVDEYAKYVRYLYENPDERQRLGNNARQNVLNNFSIDGTVAKLENIYSHIQETPKRKFYFNHIFGDKPYEWFLSCLGAEKEDFRNSIDKNYMRTAENALLIKKRIQECRLILKEKSKGSVYQFAQYYPQDKNLDFWAKLISEPNS